MSGYVYRAFDCHGRLLYVGSTASPVERLRNHSHHTERSRRYELTRQSPWFDHVGSVTVDRFDTLGQAREAEMEAIFEEMPHFNIQGRNPAHHTYPGPIPHGQRRTFWTVGLHDCHRVAS